jgi:hypothetical protein
MLLSKKFVVKSVHAFFYSACALLLITAFAKLISSFGHSTIILTRDPIMGLKFRDLFRIVGPLEIAVAMVCVYDRYRWLATVSLAWLTTNFLAYRIGLKVIGYQKMCNCLGNLTDSLHISSQTADVAMKIIFLYLLLGSYAILWLGRRHSTFTSSTN